MRKSIVLHVESKIQRDDYETARKVIALATATASTNATPAQHLL